MNEILASVVACPECHGPLAARDLALTCRFCARDFPVVNGVPVFIGEATGVSTMPEEHVSNSPGPEFEALLSTGQQLVLNLGAGSTRQKYPRCIELEYKIFRHTDVVGDAHALPFRDDSFDRIIALNVFEHLHDPHVAAHEIYRVLKPGGRAVVHTAFLQPLHEPPFHFYNATEYGVRHWFESFEIEHCRVSGNFTAPFMLGFLLSNLLASVGSTSGEAARQEIGATTLEQWASFWNDNSKWPPGLQTLQNLPNDIQARTAAGFELIAQKK
jgi:SAM-dependent methyltransferase